jgi:hypothetical protein
MFGIYDTMQFLHAPVATYCVGQAASAGAFLLATGAAGRRYALPNSRVLLHQPHGGMEGQSADLEIHAREIVRMRRRADEILAEHTGQSVETISADTDRDFILTAEEAKAYGVVDEVVTVRQLEALGAGHRAAGGGRRGGGDRCVGDADISQARSEGRRRSRGLMAMADDRFVGSRFDLSEPTRL